MTLGCDHHQITSPSSALGPFTVSSFAAARVSTVNRQIMSFLCLQLSQLLISEVLTGGPPAPCSGLARLGLLPAQAPALLARCCSLPDTPCTPASAVKVLSPHHRTTGELSISAFLTSSYMMLLVFKCSSENHQLWGSACLCSSRHCVC